MKKTIYHTGKEEGEYKVLEMEKNDKGEIFLRMKHGMKGEKENIKQKALRLRDEELAHMVLGLESMLLFDKNKVSLIHTREENKYKVAEIERSENGIFFRMVEGIQGDKESRDMLVTRLNEDELAGLYFAGKKILFS